MLRALFGFHTHWATPIMATSNEMETTSFVASLVPSSPRMMTRSSNMPNSGASTTSTTSTESHTGQPHATVICQ